MEFTVIPDEQTPEVPLVQDEFMADYIEMHREKLDVFLEYAKTRNDAVGLAANQTALDGERFMVRAFALRDVITRKWRLVIDPVITKTLGLQQCKAEGCLTWKGRVIVADRWEGVEVSYYDMDGNLHEGEVYKNFDAQIWQHEINHLNGVEEVVKDNFKEPPAIQVGRNDPCPCGSGKKYKKCCMLM